MKYLVSVIDDRTGSATPVEMAAIDVFNERLRAEGHWVFAGGLAGPGSAAVLDNRGAEPVVSHGPFVRSHDFVSGFWIIEAADFDDALALASDASRSCNRKVEVRPFLGG
jgi:hypothetical protein